MPAPGLAKLVLAVGLTAGGRTTAKNGSTRLRQHKLPASTAGYGRRHLHAMALAQLRGHTLPLRTDWLDAIAASGRLKKPNAPLPWSYRGVIHPRYRSDLLTLIDTLAGDGFGKLAPLRHNRLCQNMSLANLDVSAISSAGAHPQIALTPMGLAQSQVLHRWQYWRSQGLTPAGKHTDTCRNW